MQERAEAVREILPLIAADRDFLTGAIPSRLSDRALGASPQ